ALAANAGLLVVLALLELRQEPGLLTLLLEALERAFEGLVGLYDDLGHLLVPPPTPAPMDKRQLYITRPTLGQSAYGVRSRHRARLTSSSTRSAAISTA